MTPQPPNRYLRAEGFTKIGQALSIAISTPAGLEGNPCTRILSTQQNHSTQKPLAFPIDQNALLLFLQRPLSAGAARSKLFGLGFAKPIIRSALGG